MPMQKNYGNPFNKLIDQSKLGKSDSNNTASATSVSANNTFDGNAISAAVTSAAVNNNHNQPV